jgi:hypothetical protein
VTSCEIVGVDADAMPVTLEIFVKDTEGNNLLDYGWLDGKNVTATFKGETYELQKDVPTRAYMPHFYGFKVTARDLGSMLYFGELDGTHDMNDEFVINWGDGTFDTIVIYNDCRTTMNGGYDIKRHYVVNGVKTENHKITITKETSAPSEPKFPTLEIKGASLNTHTANIFEPVHFYLEGDDYMNWSLSQLCDSLVFSVMGKDGSCRVYYDEKGHSELIVGWDHYFYLPQGCLCSIQAYKNNEVIYTDAIEVNLTNDNDFLMYDWDEVADASKLGTVGFNNFIEPQYSIVTAAYFKENTPSVKVAVENPESLEDARTWLYDYMKKLYKDPVYSESAEVKTKYAELFVSAQEDETPLYIWKDDKSVVALVEQYDEFVPVTRVYVRAESVK